MSSSLTDQQIQELEQAYKNFKPESAPPSVSTSNLLNTDFCANWPKVKQVLEFIASLPATPPVVKDSVRVVVSAGDVVSGIICR